MKTKRSTLMRLISNLLLNSSGLLRIRKAATASFLRSVFQDRTERALTPNRVLMLVNNYAKTGIGDFGLDLHKYLARRGIHPKLVSTPISWIDFPRYFFSTLTFNAHAIFNIGLTSWGRSPLRNFLGFLAIRLRYDLGRKDIVLLHNVIEAIDLDSAGYKVSPISQKGAHLAIDQLHKIPIIVFSQRMEKILLRHYGIAPVFWHPLPVDNQTTRTVAENDLPTLLMIGYLSPYKGYDLLLDALEIEDFSTRVLIVGDEHRILSEDPMYRAFLARLRSRAQAQRITCIPKIPSKHLPKLMAKVDLGVLPYAHCQGACAAATLLISYHIPILATDLPEFRELADQGSGIVLSPRDFREFARRMKKTVGNPRLMEDLRARQKQYAQRFSWESFTDRLLDHLQ